MTTKYDVGDKVYAIDAMDSGMICSITAVKIDSISISDRGTTYWLKNWHDDEDWGEDVNEEDISKDINDLIPKFVKSFECTD